MLAASARAAFPAWSAHPDVWLIVSLIGVTYYLAVVRARRSAHGRAGRPVVTRFQVRCFVVAAGCDLGGVRLADPRAVGALPLQRAHGAAHPLLDGRRTVPAARQHPRGWRAGHSPARHTLGLVRQLSRFFWAVLVFNLVFIVIHTPAVVSRVCATASSTSAARARAGCRTGRVDAVISPLPEVPRLTPPLQMFYLFTQSILPTLPSAMLTFGGMPLYKDYAHFGRLYGISSRPTKASPG